MSTFSKHKCKDYVKKKNMMQNNWTAEARSKRTRLNEGDGTLPKSVKYAGWHCKGEDGGCKKNHVHRVKRINVVVGEVVTT